MLRPLRLVRAEVATGAGRPRLAAEVAGHVGQRLAGIDRRRRRRNDEQVVGVDEHDIGVRVDHVVRLVEIDRTEGQRPVDIGQVQVLGSGDAIAASLVERVAEVSTSLEASMSFGGPEALHEPV